MKIHFHPVSTASRPVILFCTQNEIPFEPVMVDLMKGEHKQPAFLKLNPNGLVPVLEDGGFILTESSAILKYIAEKANSPAYPKDLQQRAHVNERMDWFNTQFYRELGYHLVYPQLFPHHKRSPDPVNVATIEWGKKQLEAWTDVLDKSYLGSNKYVCDRRLPRRRDSVGRRSHRNQPEALPERRSVDDDHAFTRCLEEGPRSGGRLRRIAEGAAIHQLRMNAPAVEGSRGRLESPRRP